MKIHKQIEQFFNESPIPVYVPGIDITIDEQEIIYIATKKKIDYTNGSRTSISRISEQILKFVIRDNRVFIIGFDVI